VAGSSHDTCDSASTSEYRTGSVAVMRFTIRSPFSSIERRAPLSGASRVR
jgi:hypothetical protein